ncbi:MAG: ferritin family protein [Candidatus Cloacimonetes bacterium]|nr:ferritin family protein [Candidatus Cloacimonadota bacterium]
MDFFDIAMGIEKEGEDFYNSLAEGCAANEGMSNIFKMLANDEKKHYATFKKMKENNPQDFKKSDIFESAQEIFAGFRKQFDKVKCDGSQTDLYHKALELEKKSYDFYMEKLDEFTDPVHMEIIRKVANEEKKHMLLLENIIELVERPEYWLENAEFFHLEDY